MDLKKFIKAYLQKSRSIRGNEIFTSDSSQGSTTWPHENGPRSIPIFTVKIIVYVLV